MPNFDLDVYKRMKQNTRDNLRIISSLTAGRKLSFNYPTVSFVVQTNAERSRLNADAEYKVSAKNDNDLKFPVLALFHEAFRQKWKAAEYNEQKHIARSVADQEIEAALQGLNTLFATYNKQWFKDTQKQNVQNIIAIVSQMKIDSSERVHGYSKLDRLLFSSVNTLMTPEMSNIVSRCKSFSDIFNPIENASRQQADRLRQFDFLHRAKRKIYDNVYSCSAPQSPNMGTEKEYFEKVKQLVMAKAGALFKKFVIQGSGQSLDEYVKARENAWQAKPDDFQTKFLWVYLKERLKTGVDFRVYVNVVHSEEAHLRALSTILEFILKDERYKAMNGLKIATLGTTRRDAIVIYCKDLATARQWASLLGGLLKAQNGTVETTVPVMQKQSDKMVGVGVGAEPDLTQFMCVPTVHNGMIIEAPQSFGTYMSGVLAISLMRAAAGHQNKIPEPEKCAPYLATTFLQFGLDYLRPYRRPVKDQYSLEKNLYSRINFLTS